MILASFRLRKRIQPSLNFLSKEYMDIHSLLKKPD